MHGLRNDQKQYFVLMCAFAYLGLYFHVLVGLKRADSASWYLRICMSCIPSFWAKQFFRVTLFSRLHLFLKKNITPSSIRESVCVHEIGIRLSPPNSEPRSPIFFQGHGQKLRSGKVSFFWSFFLSSFSISNYWYFNNYCAGTNYLFPSFSF